MFGLNVLERGGPLAFRWRRGRTPSHDDITGGPVERRDQFRPGQEPVQRFGRGEISDNDVGPGSAHLVHGKQDGPSALFGKAGEHGGGFSAWEVVVSLLLRGRRDRDHRQHAAHGVRGQESGGE